MGLLKHPPRRVSALMGVSTVLYP
jgi:hypothetical protein